MRKGRRFTAIGNGTAVKEKWEQADQSLPNRRKKGYQTWELSQASSRRRDDAQTKKTPKTKKHLPQKQTQKQKHTPKNPPTQITKHTTQPQKTTPKKKKKKNTPPTPTKKKTKLPHNQEKRTPPPPNPLNKNNKKEKTKKKTLGSSIGKLQIAGEQPGHHLSGTGLKR